jgi:hypothetical protein
VIDKLFIFSEVGISGNHVEIGLASTDHTEVIKIDRATAARLINQLRRILDATQ